MNPTIPLTHTHTTQSLIVLSFSVLYIHPYIVGIPNRTSYAASKFAVQGYCEALRAEVASSGVSVHVASPGYIRTNLSRSAITGDGKLYGQMDKTTENGACIGICVYICLSLAVC